MEGKRMGFGRMAGRVAAAAACLLTAGCAGFDESGLPGSASSMARNQMMLVRAEPPTFGYYRLTSLARIYPDLGFFMEKRGVPDFLAETGSGDRDYFILYYLQKRQAFACRTGSKRLGTVEFAGPYPITDREYRTLDEFRNGRTS